MAVVIVVVMLMVDDERNENASPIANDVDYRGYNIQKSYVIIFIVVSMRNKIVVTVIFISSNRFKQRQRTPSLSCDVNELNQLRKHAESISCNSVSLLRI